MPAIMMADPGGGGRMDPEMRRIHDLETLKHIITQWNANRLDLFELSLPNEELEFTGVMRFYYQAQDLDSGQKVATKCIRVSSTATTKTIIEILIEKFRPDMKMLEVPEYALYEIHESGERKLGLDEKPLLVQLNWHKDDREGRFLLRRIDQTSQMPQQTQEDSSFKRKLSKREKKALKKQEKQNKIKDKDEGVADKLYTELPDTSFTRSISNPEAVMRRRRQQKLEKKLQQFRSKDGGPDTGGTLKIYGEALCKDVPYKTLLLSVNDTAVHVVQEMLEKYGINKAEAPNFCLVQSNLTMPDDGGAGVVAGGGTAREYLLEEDECPLSILMSHPASRGAVTFHVRRRPQDGHGPRKRKKKPMSGQSGEAGLPYLTEAGVEGREPRVVRLQMSVTEVGSEVGGGGLQIPGLLPRHCVIAHTEGVVTVTPCSPQAEVSVNSQRVVETTILQHRAMIRLGRSVWRFMDPIMDERHRFSHSAATLPGDFKGNIHGSTATLPGGHMDYNQAGMRSSTANYVHFPGGPQHGQQPRGKDAILPAVLEFREDTEDAFFNALTISLDPNSCNFKLAPTYTIYMATRFRASTHYRPELVPEDRAVRLTEMLNRVGDKILTVIQQPPHSSHAPSLSFWMANSSELLHFLKSDRHITAFSLQAQDMLADAVHTAFKGLVVALQSDLEMVLPNLLADRDDDNDSDAATVGIIGVFGSAMGLLRKCRVNAALTIQLFSQLFHFVNMWTFNTMVADSVPGQPKVNYCTHKWGLRLKRRLARIEMWAEKQGLELAADCHLARVSQAAHLLQARKGTAEDIATLSSTCFKLNSLQLKSLLSRYQPAADEAPINNEMIDTIVRVAENTVDELTKGDGRQVRLEEDFLLQLPFLLPEDNYSCDIVRGVPGGLADFLQPLQRVGLCVMTPQPTSSGHWTIYMDTPPPLTPVPRSPSEMSQITTNGDIYGENIHGPPTGYPNGPPHMAGPYHGPIPSKPSPPQLPDEPEIQEISLSKTNGMGLSIVAAKGVGKERLGIYIKAVVEGGAAWQDGRLAAGDQLLTVDRQSLVGITQERAAEIMMRTGNIVTLEVAKQGAIYHGLATLLSQPSPVMGRHPQPVAPYTNGMDYGTGPRRMSERDLRGPPVDMRGPPGPGPFPARIPQSKSTPSLHHSPEGHQHNYQNQEWLHHQMPVRTNGSRSASQQNLAGYRPPPGDMGPRLPPPNDINHRPSPNQDSGGHRAPPGPPRPMDDQSYYQNLPNGQPSYPRPRFGSQTSLTGAPPSRDRPVSAHYPQSEIHRTLPAHFTPQQRFPNPTGQRVPPPQQSSGPEKPQRQYSYDGAGETVPRPVDQTLKEPVKASSRVRFQDINTQEDHKVSTIKRNGGSLNLPNGSSSERERREQEAEKEKRQEQERERKEKDRRIEEKQRELEDARIQEEKLLAEARRRAQSARETGATPPPLPTSPPPNVTPPPTTTPGTARLDPTTTPGTARLDPTTTGTARLDPTTTPGTARLDMLLGNGTGSPSVLKSSMAKTETPTKRVSFMPPKEDTIQDEIYNSTASLDHEQMERLNLNEDPNAFISEAESLLSSDSMGNSNTDFNAPSGYTPSVIGNQEVYRDPRTRRLAEEKEKKQSIPKGPDGAKLSFKEKMRLFAQEQVGENTPKDKAKISRAQRDIEEEKKELEQTGETHLQY